MSSRYRKRNILINNDDSYNQQFKNRGVNSIEHFATAELKYPKSTELEGVTIHTENYSVGDRYYKFAQKYYGDPNYWWVIAHYNQKPTENLFNIGDVVYIPTPLTRILEILEG
tara:strand:+ start:356 stop:694 length:339 start_codon:yes stop_codon:yes gene_type:complete